MNNKTFNESLVWITLINAGYLNFTKNFLESMKVFNSTFKLIVYCIDQTSIEALKNYDNCICINAINFLKYSNLTSELKAWSEIDFKKITFSKLDAILFTLKSVSDIQINAVGYIDMDIVVLSDPTNIILELMNQNENIKIFAQCDEEYKNCNGQCSNKFNCCNICSGIIIFRNQNDIYHIFKYDENDINNFTSDQDFIRSKVFKYNIPNLTIDKNIFLNGTHPGLNNENAMIPTNTSLIHFNYLIGKNKEKFMRDKKLWFLD
jgi:hypothetical protein